MRHGLLAITLLLAGCATAAPAPRAVGEPALEAALTRWDNEDPADLRGVVVLRDGEVIAERYYGGASPADLHDVRSAGKSVTGLLMATAIDRGLVTGLDARVAEYWPEAVGTAVGSVSLADLLSMRSGLAANDDDPASLGNEDRLDEATDPLALILAVPADDIPGRTYRYNSLTASVAGIVISKAAGQPMGDFAREALFRPLGIDQWRWDADNAGYTKGQGNLRLTLRGFATIGEMVRQGGAHQGRQVIGRPALEALLAPQVRIGEEDIYADAYGGFWYTKTYRIDDRPITVHFASGNGGNKLYVIPERHMVVAIQSAAYGRGYGQRRSEEILLAVLGAG